MEDSCGQKRRPLLKRIFNIPDQQSTVYWLIEKENKWWVQVLAFMGFLLLFWAISGTIEGIVAWFLAIVLHEFGHYLVFRKSGIKMFLILLFPLGAMAAPISEEENKRSDELSWWNIGWLLLAGVTLNIILALVGLLMTQNNFLPEFGHQLFEINVALAIFNILPIGTLDGGQFLKVLFASLDEKQDKLLVVAVLMICVAAIFFIFLPTNGDLSKMLLTLLTFKNFLFVVFLFIFAGSVITKHKKDNPKFDASKQKMNLQQIYLQFFVFISLTAMSVLMMSLLF